MTKKSPNACPKCGKPHAFSVMDAEEAQLYIPVELDDEGDQVLLPGGEYRVYICPDVAERIVVPDK